MRIVYTILGVICLAAAIYFSMSGGSSSSSDLFSSYFDPHPNTVISLEPEGGDSPSPEQEAFKAYEDGKFEEAVKRFDQLLEEKPDSSISFYRANALLASNKTSHAIPVLENIAGNPKSEFQEPGKWYLALAYIRQKQFDKARKLLEEMNNDPVFPFKKKEVRKLLKKMG